MAATSETMPPPRPLAGALAALLLILGLEAGAEAPPPGELIDIGGHRLHLVCQGQGGPTVVMDAGLGGLSLEWWEVQQRLARHARTCVYDRAGYGWSDPGPQPRTSDRIVQELHTLLERAGLAPPFVLVGHSFGGYNMQLFAARHPHLTGALVLVDSSHADQVERFLAPPIGVNTAPSSGSRQRVVLFSQPRLPPNMAPSLVPLAQGFLMLPKTRKVLADEYLHFRDSAAQIKTAAGGGLVPTVVVSRGKRVWPATERGDRMERLWRELQQELADQAVYSAHLIADLSGHHIHLDQPDLVADAALMAVDAARGHLAAFHHRQDPTRQARREAAQSALLHTALR